MVDRGRAGRQGADVSQGIVRAVRAVEGSNCSGLLGMTKDGPPLRCSPIDSEQLRTMLQLDISVGHGYLLPSGSLNKVRKPESSGAMVYSSHPSTQVAVLGSRKRVSLNTAILLPSRDHDA